MGTVSLSKMYSFLSQVFSKTQIYAQGHKQIEMKPTHQGQNEEDMPQQHIPGTSYNFFQALDTCIFIEQ